MSSDDTQTLLSVDDIRRMVAERDSLNARVNALNGQIAAIRNVVGHERFDALFGKTAVSTQPVLKRPNILRHALLEVLEAHPEGLTYDDLRTLLAEQLEGYAPNTLFNTAILMGQRGEIGKIGKRLYPRSAYDALSPVELAAIKGETRPAVRKVILSLLKETGKGMTAGELKDGFEQRHGQIGANAVYAALSRLAGKEGLLTRDKETGRYMLVSQPSEP